jgi:hypothetical protein
LPLQKEQGSRIIVVLILRSTDRKWLTTLAVRIPHLLMLGVSIGPEDRQRT